MLLFTSRLSVSLSVRLRFCFFFLLSLIVFKVVSGFDKFNVDDPESVCDIQQICCNVQICAMFTTEQDVYNNNDDYDNNDNNYSNNNDK